VLDSYDADDLAAWADDENKRRREEGEPLGCCPNWPHPRMAPGQAPYTCAELARLYRTVADAAQDDPGELGERS
jgi:hypothetical protein